MATWEDFGRAVDREFEKLKTFFEEDFKPNARRGAIEALRTAAERLNELAADLERAGAHSGATSEKS
jgi:plasmid stabilization system protein ParE